MSESLVIDTEEAARLIGVKKNTVEIWRHRGIGPKYVRIGRGRGRVGYLVDDIKEWVEQHRVDPAGTKPANSNVAKEN